jgi:hypothetical protein
MDKEVTENPGRWAVITLHPALLSKTEQVARARAWGLPHDAIDSEDVSALIVDDARKVGRTTNWPAKLPKRAAFMEHMALLKPVDGQVFFATPLCVGFGKVHAQQTIEALWAAGLSVYVHSVCAVYEAGDDLTDFMGLVKTTANAWYQRASRSRQPKRKSKS